MAATPVPPEYCTYLDGQFRYQTHSIHELVEAVGTPCYLYLGDHIRNRVQQLKSLLIPNLTLKYSVKANPYPPLVSLLSELVDGFDVASPRELATLSQTGDHVSYSGPSKQLDEIRLAVDKGLIVNLESEAEMQRLLQVADELAVEPQVAVRINTRARPMSSGLSMAGEASQFGIDEEQIPSILADWPTQLAFRGFHMFGGSQCLSETALADYYEQLANLLTRLEPLTPSAVRHINIGGSLGIPYTPQDQGLDIDHLAVSINHSMQRIADLYPQAKLEFEMGRYLVGEAGLFVTRVIDVKVSRDKTFVVCDGGMNCHLAATGNLGQVIPRNYPIFLSSLTKPSAETALVDVVGPLCTPIDRLARDLSVADPQPGDLVVVTQSGAYGASASPGNFLSREPVAEALI